MRDIIGEMGGGMMGRGYAGRGYAGGGYAGGTTSPKSARPGCRFWTSPPPIHKGRETRTVNDLRAEKRMIILCLTC